MYRVVVRKLPDSPTDREVLDAVSVSVAELGGIACLIPSGAKVLIKPNVAIPEHCRTGHTADLRVLRALLTLIPQARPASISIGEGSVCATDTRLSFQAAEMDVVAAEFGVPLIDLKDFPYRKVPVPDSLCMEEIEVSNGFFEADFVISLAVLKLYYGESQKTSLSIKNMKGAVSDRHKQEFHRRELHRAIADLAKVVRPHLSVVGGSVANVGNLLLDGKPMPLGAVVIGENSLAVDMVAASIMGLQWAEVPHLAWVARQNLGPAALEEIEVVATPSLDEIRAEASSALEKHWATWAEVSPRIVDRDACTACKQSLCNALSQVEDADGRLREVCVVMGTKFLKSNEAIAVEPEGHYILMGSCTRKLGALGHWVKGCPPKPEAVARRLRDYVSGE